MPPGRAHQAQPPAVTHRSRKSDFPPAPGHHRRDKATTRVVQSSLEFLAFAREYLYYKTYIEQHLMLDKRPLFSTLSKSIRERWQAAFLGLGRSLWPLLSIFLPPDNHHAVFIAANEGVPAERQGRYSPIMLTQSLYELEARQIPDFNRALVPRAKEHGTISR